uniref:Uncharacterized protein n=1 Tax=Melanthalia intermedia TaxID=172989 RepID=A0A345UAP0_9FLOR|nr:hypothetical protein [Melanthalia intermedia]AXI97526.1 hypothetical protein [Melanthalia intermedia]
MNILKTLFVSIILVNPFKVCRISTFNKYDLTDFSLHSFDYDNLGLKSSITQTILVKTADHLENQLTNNDPENELQQDEEDTRLISNLKDKVFPKDGSSYSERRKAGSSSSKIVRELNFRSTTKEDKHGKEKPTHGASDPTNPTNLRNFDKVGIPIDPMKDRRKKPDNHNNWRWNDGQKKWILHGEPKLKLSNGRVVTEKEWQRMLINRSGKT